ncbi:MAG: hypothetical protein GY928_16665 [Colwellia sp.]|nr:hypothetical protein [Colwellia sp.]
MFEQAIEQLESTGQIIGNAQPFRKYVMTNNLNVRGTAPHISINRFNDLKPELREAGCTVFRLGSHGEDHNTWFSLARTVHGWSDYFLFDEEVFGNLELRRFTPLTSHENLFTYRLISKLTETSLVNLAFASGVLPSALGVANTKHQSIPATGKSIFTFKFKPNSESTIWLSHVQGQVEIDALFTGTRQGKDCLFVVEAKSGKRFDSLNKLKLAYPIFALQRMIPVHWEVIPVYLRTIRKKGCIEFNIAECSFPRNRNIFGAVNELCVVNASRFMLEGY